MKIEEFEDIISHYRWLLCIKTAYQAHLNYMSKMKDCYTICGIVYQAGGDASTMDINPHRPIDPSFLAKGLDDAISRIDDEIKETAEKLRQAGFDIESTQGTDPAVTQSEYFDDGVKREKNQDFWKFHGNVYVNVSDLITDLSVYPDTETKKFENKRAEIVNAIMDVVHKCLPQFE